MLYIPIGLIILLATSGIAYLLFSKFNIMFTLVIGVIMSAIIGIIITIDFDSQTSDIEMWSGTITNVEHKEEWDEWIPPKTRTYTTTVNGKPVTHTTVTPGYWQHHNATNTITTSDRGRISIHKVPDGRKLTDSFVNSTEELASYYPIGSPTASTHSYTNKIKASYSIFKHKEINLDDYPDLPKYPTQVNSKYSIDRLIGDFGADIDVLNEQLSKLNSTLNDTNNPNNINNVKSYKQVNIIMVNFGDKDINYGYALQDYWRNGAKNDLVITFGVDSNNKPTWSYVFSWTDVEILKTDIREYIMNLENINNFSAAIEDVGNMVEEKFERKEFVEFDYIQISVGRFATICIWIIIILACGVVFIVIKEME